MQIAAVLAFCDPPVKDGLIAAAGNIEDERLVRALRSKIQLNALSQFGCIDTYILSWLVS